MPAGQRDWILHSNARNSGRSGKNPGDVSQLLTLDRSFLTEQAGTLPVRLQGAVDQGLRLVLEL
jgi:hypothetical protein